MEDIIFGYGFEVFQFTALRVISRRSIELWILELITATSPTPNVARAWRINGRKLAVLWTAPFRADITGLVQAGDNEIEIEITNTWHNRLAYDASLPAAERKTWTISAPKAAAPVKLAGLVGPVQVRVGK